jgi:hypothetical protein
MNMNDPDPGTPSDDQVSNNVPAPPVPAPASGRVAARRESIPAPAPVPFSSGEVIECFLPHKLIECVLGQKDRLMAGVVERRHLGPLILLLFAGSIVFALPFGAVPPVQCFWKVAALFAGSVAICFPSLHVFSQYLGLKLTFAQNLAVALVVSCVAAIFSFGFFPIIWFIDFSTDAAVRGDATSGVLAAVLLAASLFLGIIHMLRCLAAGHRPVDAPPSAAGHRQEISGPHFALVLCWMFLLAFITYRMALVLGLSPW